MSPPRVTMTSDSSPGMLFREVTCGKDSGITWLVDDMNFVTSSADAIYVSGECPELMMSGEGDRKYANSILTSCTSSDSLRILLL